MELKKKLILVQSNDKKRVRKGISTIFNEFNMNYFVN